MIESRARSPLMPSAHFPQPVGGQRGRGRAAGRRGAVVDVLLPLALPAAGAALLGRCETGVSYLPLAVGIILSAGARVGARPADRRQARADRRLGSRSPAGWFGSATCHAHGSYSGDVLGPSLIVASGLGFCFVPCDHPRGERHDRPRRGTGLGPDQHRRAGRRRDRPGRRGDGRHSRTDPDARSTRASLGAPGALTDGFSRAFIVGAGLRVLGHHPRAAVRPNRRPAGDEPTSHCGDAARRRLERQASGWPPFGSCTPA